MASTDDCCFSLAGLVGNSGRNSAGIFAALSHVGRAMLSNSKHIIVTNLQLYTLKQEITDNKYINQQINQSMTFYSSMGNIHYSKGELIR